MNLIDVIIIVAAGYAMVRGYEGGLLRQGLSMVGFFVGLLLGSLLAAKLTSTNTNASLRILLVIFITLGSASLLSGLGEFIGLKLRHAALRLKIQNVDAVFGAIFELLAVLVAAWLLASIFSTTQVGGLNREIKQSKIISALERTLPPAPNVVARLGSIIAPNGFPRVFIGPEPAPETVTSPQASDVASAVASDQASVVKITGLGCGGIVEGSGFVASSGLVATNAHVVAGVSRIRVIDQNGSHTATPVLFDPDLDFAVLRTDNLAGAPLALVPHDVPRGTIGAALGYPGGGPFTASPGVVLDETTALGRNIYNQGLTSRNIYELQATIEPGNSGGPLVASDGTVIGVIFAKAISNDSIGYALTSTEINPELRQARQQTAPVSTGGVCASG